MKPHEVQKLDHGLYVVTWKSGGDSLAAVGSKYDGSRWICPTNWTSDMDKGTDAYGDVWERVQSVRLIASRRQNGEGYRDEDGDWMWRADPNLGRWVSE